MSKEVILHIGAGKTGTSSIQRCLSNNANELLNHDIYVPSTDLSLDGQRTGQHVWYFASLRKKTIEEAKTALETNLRAQLKTQSQSKILLSAENLSDRNGISSLFKDLAKEYTFKIIFYIRRQDNYLLSAWQQWFAKADNDFWAWMLRSAGNIGNWKLVIEDWESVIPRENIQVRIYDRQELVNEDVVSDFFNLLNVPTSSLNIESGSNQNPSFNLGIIDLVEKNSNLFEGAHDNEFYNFLAKFSPSSKKISKHSPISFKQRMAILSKYNESNNWILENYFPKGRNHLFKNPTESDFVELSSDQLEDLKWKSIVELSYNMHRFYKNKK